MLVPDRRALGTIVKIQFHNDVPQGWIHQQEPIAPASYREQACCAIIIDEDGRPEMWVMGGCESSNFTQGFTYKVRAVTCVEAYKPSSNHWRTCAPMRYARTGAVAGVIHGRLVVAGGIDSGINCYAPDLDRFVGYSVELYQKDQESWDLISSMPAAAVGATACVYDDRLYVMGGFNSNKLQVLEMSGDAFTWTIKADLLRLLRVTDGDGFTQLKSTGRVAATSVVHKKKIWLIGGKLQFSPREDQTMLLTYIKPTVSVLIYDISSDTWEEGPALPNEADVIDQTGSLYGYPLESPTYCQDYDHRNCPCRLHAAVVDCEVHVWFNLSHFILRGNEWKLIQTPIDEQPQQNYPVLMNSACSHFCVG